MPVRFAGRRQTARRKQAAEKQKAGAKSPQKSAEKDTAGKTKASPTRRVKSAPPSTSARRTKQLPPVDYDQALRKLVRASEILERSTVMEKDVEENLEKIQQRLEPLREDKN